VRFPSLVAQTLSDLLAPSFSPSPDWITTSAPPRTRVNLAVLTDQDSEGKEPSMLIIGCDFHSRFQQIAMLDTETGELNGRC
jgi:hypothetical protein